MQSFDLGTFRFSDFFKHTTKFQNVLIKLYVRLYEDNETMVARSYEWQYKDTDTDTRLDLLLTAETFNLFNMAETGCICFSTILKRFEGTKVSVENVWKLRKKIKHLKHY